MSTTMRPTLQTVPESLPADHITNPLGTTVTSTAPSEPAATKSSHSHTSTSLKGRTSSTKVLIYLLIYLTPSRCPIVYQLCSTNTVIVLMH